MANNKEIRIKFKIDSNTNEVVLLKNEVNKLGKSFNDADTFANTFMKRINLATHMYAGYQAFNRTLGAIAKNGIIVNREFQKLNNTLATSIAITSKNVDSMGNNLSIMDKYSLATSEATRTTAELQKINVNTPHVLNQTVKIYDAMYIGMKKVGATTADIVEITEKLSIAVGDKIGFDAMLSAMDGLSTGTVEAASEMGRFLKAIGLSNEEIKNSANVVELFKEKLSDVKSIESFDTKLSNLNNSFDMFTKNIMDTSFAALEDSFEPLADIIDRMNKGLTNVRINFSSVDDLTLKEDLIFKRKLLNEEYEEIKNDKFMLDSEQKRRLKEIQNERMLLSEKLTKIFKDEEKLSETVYNFDSKAIDDEVYKTLKPYEYGLNEINNKWSTHYSLMVKNGKNTSSLIEAWTKSISAYDKGFSKSSDKQKNQTKELAEEQTKYYEYQRGLDQELYESKGNFEKAWAIEREKIEEQLFDNDVDLESQHAKEKIRILKSEYFDKVNNSTFAHKT